jgi:RNase adaptor protein for sRNA GlmZ degradation
MDDLVRRLEDAFDLVKEWPEKDPNGFMNLLALRNLVPEAAARIAELKAERDLLAFQVETRDTSIFMLQAAWQKEMAHADRLSARIAELEAERDALLARLEEEDKQ